MRCKKMLFYHSIFVKKDRGGEIAIENPVNETDFKTLLQ